MRTRFLTLLLAVILGMASGCALADEVKDHDRARQALESGEILPLRRILEKIEMAYPGQVLEVELERKQGRWIYELKLLQKDGLRIKLLVNAADGEVLSNKRK